MERILLEVRSMNAPELSGLTLPYDASGVMSALAGMKETCDVKAAGVR
jgi:hypothetical protein